MTKFGYVRREATNQIDWSAVASQFTSVLQEEAKSRAQQKAELDRASREMVETLQNSPTGEYVDGNKFTANYAADAMQVLLTQDRLLKQGILKPRDYAVVRANLNSSNKQMFKLGQAYQEAYKKKMERMNSADPATRSQLLEQWKMEQAEGLYNLRNTKALINPNNGMVSIGLWKDGKMDTNPGSYATVPELMGNLVGEYNYYDVRKDVQQAVDDLGIIDEIDIKYAAQGGLDKIFKISSQGGKYSGDDKVLKEYFEWAGYTAEGMMSNPFHVTSILTNENLRASNGEQYTFTYEPDASKRKPNEIYLDRTNNRGGEPVFTDEQRAQVKDAIIERLNDSVDRKIDVKTSRVPYEPQDVRRLEQTKKDDQATFNKLSDLYYGDETAVRAAETYFRDNFNDVSRVQKKGNVIFVTNIDGTTKEVPLVDAQGNLMGFEDFAESAVLLTGISNIKDSVDLAGGKRTGVVSAVRSTDREGFYEVEFKDGRVETIAGDVLKSPYKVGQEYELGSIVQTSTGAGISQAETPQQQVNRYYDQELTSTLSDGSSTEFYVMQDLAPLLTPFGFKIYQADAASAYRLRIEKGEGNEFIFETDGGQDALNNLLNFVKGNTSAEEAAGQQAFLTNKIGQRTIGGSGGGLLD